MADLTLKEIRELVSKEYEIKPDARYLLVFNSERVPRESLQLIAEHWESVIGKAPLILYLDDPENAVKLLEITDAKPNP